MNEPQRVVIVGGGIIGIASAYFLRKAGLDVTLIDQDRMGAACSHGNCGLISPSHILPLTQPGALPQGFRALFQSNGPLRISPGLNFSLWTWLLKFASHCNKTDMYRTGHARHAILDSSRALYEQIITEHGIECHFKTAGCMFVFRDEEHFDEHAKLLATVEKEYDVKYNSLVGDELLKKEPAFKPGATYGAFHYEPDGHLRPDKLIQGWLQVLREMGVTLLEQCKMTAFQADGGQARAIETSQGPLEADQFVVATGPVTPFLNKQLGFNVPIQPGKGYSITTSCPSITPKHPMICEQDRVAITPMTSVFRIGSTMEFAGYNTKLSPKRLQLLRDGATKYLREPFGEEVIEEWYGWRPMTPDGKAIIDYTPKYKNVLLAAGHNMLGLSMAPATGRLVTEILTDQPQHMDWTPFRYPRRK